MNAPLKKNPKLNFFGDQPRSGQRRSLSFMLAEDNQLGRAGQLVELTLTPSDVHEPAELETYLAGYVPEDMVADLVSPVIPTEFSSDKYRSFTEDDAFLLRDVRVSTNQKVPEVDPETEVRQYTVDEFAAGSFVSERVKGEARWDAVAVALQRCSRALMMWREVQVKTLLTSTASWESDNHVTLSSTTKWNGGSASDPIKDLQERIQASAQRVRGILMSERVSQTFIRHPAVRDHLAQFVGSRGVDGFLQDLGAERYKLPGLPEIVVTAHKHKATKASSLDYTWGNDVVLWSAPPAPPTNGEGIATSYTFRLNGPNGVGFVTREFRVEDRGSLGGTFVVAAMAEDIVMPGPNCGGLIKSVVQ